MLRAKYLLLLPVALLAALVFALSSCGGGGGGGGEPPAPPFIGAELISFPAGSVPPGFNNGASVVVLDGSSGDSIATATVIMNGVQLTYNAANQDYEGDVVVAPGGSVALSVTTAGGTFTASTTQFTSYPTLSTPAPLDTWDSSVTNTVAWSGGTPTANAEYLIGILDAVDPNGLVQWPESNSLKKIPLGTTSFPIPAVSIPAGNRLVIAGIASSGTPIPGAAPGSGLFVAGFNYAPITVTGFPLTVRSSGTDFKVGVSNELAAVAWTGTQFIAVGIIPGSSFATNVGAIRTSPDGITWTSRNSGTSAGLSGVAASGTRIVVVGQNATVGGDATILTSDDGGVSWTPRASGATGGLSGVAWSGTQFVAVGSNPTVSGTILTSPDGITWTSRTSGTSSGLSAVAWSGTQFVAVGTGGVVLTSPDGTTWTERNSNTSTSLRSVTWSGTQFAAVGSFFSDAIVTSPDGVTWTPRSSSTTAGLLAIASSGTEFVAVGWVSNVGAKIITSPDGVTWTSRAPGTGNTLSGIAWSGTKFVIVGGIGTVLTSP